MKAVRYTKTVKPVKQDTSVTHFPKLFIILGTCHNVENSTLLGYYAACSGNYLTDISVQPISPNIPRQCSAA
jgi:hypothetical protein